MAMHKFYPAFARQKDSSLLKDTSIGRIQKALKIPPSCAVVMFSELQLALLKPGKSWREKVTWTITQCSHCSLAILSLLWPLAANFCCCCCSRRPRSDFTAAAGLSLAEFVRLRGPVGLLRPMAVVLPEAAAAATAWLE